ncbi:hypothetical protein B7463_g10786, partial [Scytalidium lignicola]
MPLVERGSDLVVEGLDIAVSCLGGPSGVLLPALANCDHKVLAPGALAALATAQNDRERAVSKGRGVPGGESLLKSERKAERGRLLQTGLVNAAQTSSRAAEQSSRAELWPCRARDYARNAPESEPAEALTRFTPVDLRAFALLCLAPQPLITTDLHCPQPATVNCYCKPANYRVTDLPTSLPVLWGKSHVQRHQWLRENQRQPERESHRESMECPRKKPAPSSLASDPQWSATKYSPSSRASGELLCPGSWGN